MHTTPRTLKTDEHQTPRYWPVAAMLVLGVGFSVLLFVFRESVNRLGDFGYVGAFFIMIVNNATIVFPALGHAFIVTTAHLLHPLVLGLVGGVGATLGELTGYVLGRTGHGAIGQYGVVRTLRRYRGRRLFGVALLMFALTPLPMDVAGVIAGTSRYPVWRFLVWVGIGKVLNTTMVAVASYYAIGWMQKGFFG